MLSPLFPSCHSFPTVLHCGFRTGERPGLSLDGGVNAVCQLKVPTPMFRISVSIDTSPHGCPSVGCSLPEPPWLSVCASWMLGVGFSGRVVPSCVCLPRKCQLPSPWWLMMLLFIGCFFANLLQFLRSAFPCTVHFVWETFICSVSPVGEGLVSTYSLVQWLWISVGEIAVDILVAFFLHCYLA